MSIIRGFKRFKRDYERNQESSLDRSIRLEKKRAELRKYQNQNKPKMTRGGGRGAAMLSSDFVGGGMFGGGSRKKKRGGAFDFI